MTGIPQNNYESLQILEYQVGQFYKRHHDSSGKKDKASGHRILTFFLYLNDVEGMFIVVWQLCSLCGVHEYMLVYL